MKNKFLYTVLLFVCLIVFLCSCAKETASFSVPVTQDQAIQLVKKIKYDPAFYYDCDGNVEVGGKQYIIVHVYVLPVDYTEGDMAMVATMGWYYVDVNSGKVYLAEAGLDDHLILQDS